MYSEIIIWIRGEELKGQKGRVEAENVQNQQQEWVETQPQGRKWEHL